MNAYIGVGHPPSDSVVFSFLLGEGSMSITINLTIDVLNFSLYSYSIPEEDALHLAVYFERDLWHLISTRVYYPEHDIVLFYSC